MVCIIFLRHNSILNFGGEELHLKLKFREEHSRLDMVSVEVRGGKKQRDKDEVCHKNKEVSQSWWLLQRLLG